MRGRTVFKKAERCGGLLVRASGTDVPHFSFLTSLEIEMVSQRTWRSGKKGTNQATTLGGHLT